ncbi:MAG TPA: hypothetical protein VGL75_19200 [Acidothermaceae bacterium]|jgi:hypothetical protein
MANFITIGYGDETGYERTEAPTLADAIDIVSQTPRAVAQGVVEVWLFEKSSQRPTTWTSGWS